MCSVCAPGFWGLGCSNKCDCASDLKECSPTTGECACPAGEERERREKGRRG